MLRTLEIKNFVIVDHTEIEFSPGFTVFSGETGAGKSILIDALSLALGDKTDSSVIREGAEKTEIVAYFDLSDITHAWLKEHDISPEDGLLVKRTIDRQGKSRAYINGTAVTLSQLRSLGERLVDIHGQHAHQSLLKTDAQRDILDTHGQLLGLRSEVQQAFKHWQSLKIKLDRVQKDTEQLRQQQEQLQWQAETLQEVNLQEGEWEAIKTEHERLAHAHKLIEGTNTTLASLDSDEDSVERRLYHACQQITQLSTHDPHLEGILQTLTEAQITISDAISELNSYLSRIELDPQRLSELDDRLHQVFDCARKFKVSPDELPRLQTHILAQLSTLQDADDIPALELKTEAAYADYLLKADTLSTARHDQANKLSSAVTEAMQALSMSGGRFSIGLQKQAPTAYGYDAIEFNVAGHAGSTPKPLNKVASGGELARISLALSVIASQATRVPTLIFDEVDTGIGGAVAEVVGKLLQALGQRHQVLCVTHLPQVAAKGHMHFEVKKRLVNDQTVSDIKPLDRYARVDEIARMLGGINITDTTRQHAREMLGT